MSERCGNTGEDDRHERAAETAAMDLASAELEKVTVKILGFTGESVTVEYVTIAGNRPRSNGNMLWLWEGTVIDWKHPDLGKKRSIPSEDSKGSTAMKNVNIGRKEYIVGYSVTGCVAGICGSGLVKPDVTQLAPESVTIAIDTLTPELKVSYATLRGYKPLSAGNWLGLWRGDVLPWDAPPPAEVAHPEDDANEGMVTFHTSLRSKSTYTIIYFMADPSKQTENTSAAALLRFDTT